MFFQTAIVALSIFMTTAAVTSGNGSAPADASTTTTNHSVYAHETPTTTNAMSSVAIAKAFKGSGESLNNTDVLADTWIYPDAAGALETLQSAQNINALKVEFLHVEDDGTLRQINQSEDYPNGYSPENVALIKQHSKEQYITVSGALEGTRQLMKNPQTIDQMVALADKTGFDVELDWEEYGEWDADYYKSFKAYLADLAKALHAHGHKLMIDGPPMYDKSSQAWYQWKYEELQPLVDDILMMVYDNQFDTGAGNSIAPQQWTEDCLKWLHDKTNGKGIAGVAAYGYEGKLGSYHSAINTSDGIIRRAGDIHFTRNSDGELTATKDGIFYDISDQQTLVRRLDQVEQSGLKRLSVWSLGQNPWFK